MKKRLTNNLGIKIGSLALAIVIWIVIQSVADPPDTLLFTNVPVEIRNEEVLTEKDEKFTYTVVSGDTASFTVEARTSVLNHLSASDFTVYADMTKLSQVGAVPVEIVPKNSSLGVTVLPHTNTLVVEVDELIEKTVSVDVRIQGDPGDGYTTGDVTSNPNLVKVRGPKSLIDTAKSLVVTVNVSGQGGVKDEQGHEKTTLTVTEADPKLYDGNDEEITASTVEIDLPQPITVSVDILRTVEVGVDLSFDGFTAADGYAIVGEAEYSPKSIQIAGTKEALEEFLDELPDGEDGKILRKTVSGSGYEPLSENFESFYELIMDDDIKIVDDAIREKGIPYQINVEQKITSSYPTTFNKIILIGKNPQYEYRLEGDDGSGRLSVNVTGVAAAVDQLNNADADSIELSVNVTDLEPGIYTCPLKGVFPNGVELDSNQEITLVIEGPEESE